jgi:hypothetical protein
LKLHYGNTGRGTDIMAGKLYFELGWPSEVLDLETAAFRHARQQVRKKEDCR